MDNYQLKMIDSAHHSAAAITAPLCSVFDGHIKLNDSLKHERVAYSAHLTEELGLNNYILLVLVYLFL